MSSGLIPLGRLLPFPRVNYKLHDYLDAKGISQKRAGRARAERAPVALFGRD